MLESLTSRVVFGWKLDVYDTYKRSFFEMIDFLNPWLIYEGRTDKEPRQKRENLLLNKNTWQNTTYHCFPGPKIYSITSFTLLETLIKKMFIIFKKLKPRFFYSSHSRVSWFTRTLFKNTIAWSLSFLMNINNVVDYSIFIFILFDK